LQQQQQVDPQQQVNPQQQLQQQHLPAGQPLKDHHPQCSSGATKAVSSAADAGVATEASWVAQVLHSLSGMSSHAVSQCGRALCQDRTMSLFGLPCRSMGLGLGVL
jgi:hypothetical protein